MPEVQGCQRRQIDPGRLARRIARVLRELRRRRGTEPADQSLREPHPLALHLIGGGDSSVAYVEPKPGRIAQIVTAWSRSRSVETQSSSL